MWRYEEFTCRAALHESLRMMSAVGPGCFWCFPPRRLERNHLVRNCIIGTTAPAEQKGPTQMSSQNPTCHRALSALTAVVLVAALIPYAAIAMPSFDGVWYVSIVTKKGKCESSNRYPVRITSGALSNASDIGLVIYGTVSESGQVTVVVNNGNRSAAGSGHLSGKSGTGKWIGASCSGTWSASRRQNGRKVSFQ
jgi:hypothetical protein